MLLHCEMSTSCSMETLHSLCKKKGIDLETFLSSLGADHEITNEDVTTIKELRKALKEQFDRMDNRWNVLNSTDPDPFKDEMSSRNAKKTMTMQKSSKIRWLRLLNAP